MSVDGWLNKSIADEASELRTKAANARTRGRGFAGMSRTDHADAYELYALALEDGAAAIERAGESMGLGACG